MEVSVLAPDSPSLQVVNDLNTDEYEEVEVDLHKAALKAISQRPSIIECPKILSACLLSSLILCY